MSAGPALGAELPVRLTNTFPPSPQQQGNLNGGNRDPRRHGEGGDLRRQGEGGDLRRHGEGGDLRAEPPEGCADPYEITELAAGSTLKPDVLVDLQGGGDTCGGCGDTCAEKQAQTCGREQARLAPAPAGARAGACTNISGLAADPAVQVQQRAAVWVDSGRPPEPKQGPLPGDLRSAASPPPPCSHSTAPPAIAAAASTSSAAPTATAAPFDATDTQPSGGGARTKREAAPATAGVGGVIGCADPATPAASAAAHPSTKPSKQPAAKNSGKLVHGATTAVNRLKGMRRRSARILARIKALRCVCVCGGVCVCVCMCMCMCVCMYTCTCMCCSCLFCLVNRCVLEKVRKVLIASKHYSTHVCCRHVSANCLPYKKIHRPSLRFEGGVVIKIICVIRISVGSQALHIL